MRVMARAWVKCKNKSKTKSNWLRAKIWLGQEQGRARITAGEDNRKGKDKKRAKAIARTAGIARARATRMYENEYVF